MPVLPGSRRGGRSPPAATGSGAIEKPRLLGYAGPRRGMPGCYRGNRSMKITTRVRKILANYESDNPGSKAKLASILMHGRLGGSGKLVILPVDQGFEHGPVRSFGPNPAAY